MPPVEPPPLGMLAPPDEAPPLGTLEDEPPPDEGLGVEGEGMLLEEED